MAVSKFAENVYSFRKYDTLYYTLIQPKTTDEIALAAIEAKMVSANNLFATRQYQSAIDAYNEARALIYAQIDTSFQIGHYPSFPYPMAPGLFDSFLSLGVEYLNVFTLQGPPSTVRPRVNPDPAQMTQARNFDKIGITATQFTTPAANDTLADFQLADRLKAAGNTAASDFFLNRAKATDANTLQILQKNAPTPTATVPIAPVPSTPRLLTTAKQPTLTRFDSSVSLVSADVGRAVLPAAGAADRTVGLLVNGNATTFAWKAGDAPPLQQIKTSSYASRLTTTNLQDLYRPIIQPSDLAINLPHEYYYVIPLALAECYHALGDWVNAESMYFVAASYQFLNATIEAPYLFQRLTSLYLDWGNSLYRAGAPADALPIYSRVVTPAMGVPGSTLYTTASLAPGANAAKLVIPKLGDTTQIAALTVNPALASLIVEVWQQLTKIAGGLDFWGFWSPSVPIWTFDFLQSAAINFAQLAMNAEKDYINFQDRADQGALTRQQLSQSVTQSVAEVQAAQLQAAAAAAEVTAYQDGVTLAQTRAANARADAADYASKSWGAILYQAESAQVSGGDDGDADQINRLANQFLSGQTIEDSRGTVAGAVQLAGAKLNREYEINSLNRQAADLDAAAVQAQSELNASKARAAAANAGATVAQLRANAAQDLLNTFDEATFTPDVWHAMGVAVKKLYNRYLNMALHVARTMQQAYNFEMDASLHLIKADYSSDEVKGLLAADSLLADIETFTFQMITSQTNKPQPVKQTISLATRYPYKFQNGLRKTGIMEFQTRIDDFDYYYPGSYAGRLEGIEVEVDGIVPITGISGTLTNSGISFYRSPSSLNLKTRVQSKETLVLSDYSPRQDAIELTNDQRMMRIFQGAGTASTWRLEYPKAINDIDYSALTDVRLTFYYKARYDPALHDSVIANLASLPGINKRHRGIPLRWLYPDAFFHFQSTGQLNLTLTALDFRNNETLPTLNNIGILVATDGSVPASNIKVALATPAMAVPITATTDAAGAITTGTSGPWTPLATGTALGNYRLSVSAADNPQLVKNGVLVLAPITNIVLLFEYTFVPRS